MTLDAIEIETQPQPTAALIILHGLGADGSDFVPLVRELQLGAIGPVRCVMPSAPVMPVTLNGGHEMRAWYDIVPTPQGGRVEDEAGLRRSQAEVNALIEREIARGIAPSRIVLMGFSQGCAMTLMAGLRSPHTLAGLAALSGYLPLPEHTEAERHAANLHTPIFMAHGEFDDVVVPSRGEHACAHLRKLGHTVSWHSYPMTHTLCLQEVHDLNHWLLQVLG